MVLHQLSIRDQLYHHIFFRDCLDRGEQFGIQDGFIVVLEEIDLSGVEVNVEV